MGIDSNLTHVLGLSSSILASGPVAYPERVDNDTRLNNAMIDIDQFAGHLTASLCETFYVSGSLSSHLGAGSSLVAGEFYGGLRHNGGATRHIVKVVAYVRQSGSGGVTLIDVRKGTGGLAMLTDKSLFSNAVFKCILSASDGAMTARETSTFAPSSQSWAPGQFIGVVLNSVQGSAANALNDATDLTVQVYWKPSASYNS